MDTPTSESPNWASEQPSQNNIYEMFMNTSEGGSNEVQRRLAVSGRQNSCNVADELIGWATSTDSWSGAGNSRTTKEDSVSWGNEVHEETGQARETLKLGGKCKVVNESKSRFTKSTKSEFQGIEGVSDVDSDSQKAQFGDDTMLWEKESHLSRGQYQYLQIQNDHSNTSFEVSKFDGSNPGSLLSCLNQKPSAKLSWRFNLLIFPRQSASVSDPFSISARIQIGKYWSIPEICFNAHENLWSGVMNYAPVRGDDSWKGYLIRTDKSWNYSCTLAISHHSKSNTTYGVCVGLQLRESRELVDHLDEWKQFGGNPLFTPIALASLYLSTTILINRRHNDDFYNIQTAMKTDHYISTYHMPQALDLVEFASKLTALGTSSAGVTQLCSTQNRILQFLGEHLDLLEETAKKDDVLASLRERHTFLKEILQAERQHNAYTKEAVQAQVQMVYSLTAQRDNEHNLNLARLSQKQNSINIQISKFAAYESRLSNKMAKSSLKDGVDMQIIAAVTLTFLPGTFIATLFSTSFWNFQPGNQGNVVSKWVWLY